jgi:rare lipoprotein A
MRGHRHRIRTALLGCVIAALGATGLAGCAATRPGGGAAPPLEEGIASYYGAKFHRRATASGETYSKYEMTAAHRTLPFGTRLRVTHLGNGREVTVRVNDRGPFVEGRIIDLSYAAASALGMIRDGTAKVRLHRLQP